jgi:hypothetical protein
MRGVSYVTLDSLIRAALTGQPYSQQRLGAEAERYALKVSRAKAPDLPDDQHDEVCLEAFVELLKLDGNALSKHSGKILFRRAVLAAIRNVRASYAPPGERTRPAKKPRPPKVAAEDIGRIADEKILAQCTVSEGEFIHIAFERIPDPRQEAEIGELEASLDAEVWLRRAPPPVATALRLIYLDGEPVETVAAARRVTRFVLNRQIKVFFADCRAAA